MATSFRELYNQLRSWAGESANRSIFLAALTVGGGTVIVKGIAMFKELVIAYQFGTAGVLDAFLIAFMVPSFAVNVVAGAIEAAFMPTYIEVLEQKGEEEGQALLGSILLSVGGVLFAVCLVMAAIGPFILPLVASGFSASKLALTETFYYLLLPIVLLKGIAIVWMRVLNARDQYALASLAPAALPACLLVLVLSVGDTWGGYVLIVGTVVGHFLEALVLAGDLVRKDLWVWPKWGGRTAAFDQAGGQFFPMIVGTLLMSSASLVDQSMATMLGSGKVAALNYANKIPSALIGLGSTALSTAVLPHFSRMTAEHEWDKLRGALKTYIYIVFFVSLPFVAIFGVFSEDIVRIVFERGEFQSKDTKIVSLVQSLYVLQIPFYVLSTLVSRVLSSVKMNKYLMYGSILSITINIVMNYIFMKWIGLAGIALSTSVVYLVSFVFLYFLVSVIINKN